MAKILIVDDNLQNLYMLEILFNSNGFSVLQARNGEEALNLARKDLPDLVISDILMPVMDGFNLCRNWKKDATLKMIPFIFYTATYTDQKDEEFALSLGAEKFIIKPQDPDQLLRITNEVLHSNLKKPSPRKKKVSFSEEESYYREYSETLVRKLEKKMLQLEEANKRLLSFYRVSCILVSSKNVIEAIDLVIQAIHEIIKPQKVTFFSINELDHKLVLHDAVGFSEDVLPALQEKINNLFFDSQSAQKGKKNTLVGDFISENSLWNSIDENIHTVLMVPVHHKEELYGVFGLFSNEDNAFSEDRTNIVSLANTLAISINDIVTRDELHKLNLSLENRIKERTAQLLTSNKDLEAFAYSVSHDLRAPLRAIDGYSSLVVNEYRPKLDENGIKYLDQISQNAIKMDKFITDLLTLSKVGLKESHYQIVQVETLINEVIEDVLAQGEKCAIELNLSALTEINSDPIIMRQIFENLIRNAVKYSSLKSNPKIRISSEDHEDSGLFLVEDNGIGFRQDMAQELFLPFRRLYSEDQFEGTGVGLAIVKRLVEREGGKVWAEGKSGEGAKFFISIPKQPKSCVGKA